MPVDNTARRSAFAGHDPPVVELAGLDFARGLSLSALRPPRAIDLPLARARSLVLAETVVATDPMPRFDNSAMDGHAIRMRDLASGLGAPPSAAGSTPTRHSPAPGVSSSVSS